MFDGYRALILGAHNQVLDNRSFPGCTDASSARVTTPGSIPLTEDNCAYGSLTRPIVFTVSAYQLNVLLRRSSKNKRNGEPELSLLSKWV